MAVLQVTRSQVLRHRAKTQGLVGATDVGVLTPTVVDLGVQDTGPDGALWALALRGAPVTASPWPEELALAWTVRGAPHAYRRSELSEVAAAVRPWSHADAAKRVYDAAKPLRDASIPVGVALATVATAMRDLVTGPTAKGDVSGGLTALLPEPYLIQCRVCGVQHPFEMPFRLASLFAGLELEAGTSPPVLTPVEDWPTDHIDALAHLPVTIDGEPGADTGDAGPGEPLDLLVTGPALLGPLRPADLAGYLDAPLAEVRARWDARLASGELVEVDVEGTRCALPAGQVRALLDAASPPRASRRRLTVRVEARVPWGDDVEDAVDREIERLGRHRGVSGAERA